MAAQSYTMKDDMSVYAYEKGTMTHMTPAPQYTSDPFKHVDNPKDKPDNMSIRNKNGTAGYTKKRRYLNMQRGRFHTHFKLDEIQKDMQKIRDNETALSQKKKGKRPKVDRQVVLPHEVDEGMLLVVDTEFDWILKNREAELERKKKINSGMIRELVWKLGYLDYRDALALNKYILEARRSEDTNQIVRAQVLEEAMKQLKSQKMKDIEKRAAKDQNKDAAAEALEQEKLDLLMNENPEYARMYQEMYKEKYEDPEMGKRDKKDKYDRFKIFLDEDFMNANKEELEMIQNQLTCSSDENLSDGWMTDFEENTINQAIYQEYKAMHRKLKYDRAGFDEEFKEFKKEMANHFIGRASTMKNKLDELEEEFVKKYGMEIYGERPPSFNSNAPDNEQDFVEGSRKDEPTYEDHFKNEKYAMDDTAWYQQYIRLFSKTYHYKTFVKEIEEKFAHVRAKNRIFKMDYSDVKQAFNGDPTAEDPLLDTGRGFLPFTDVPDEIKNYDGFPAELRRHLNLTKVEKQVPGAEILDEDTRQEHLEEVEWKQRYLKAKWDWYLNWKYSQWTMTSPKLIKEQEFAEFYDDWLKPRVEYMYSHLDYNNERHEMRDKFCNEMHKKTSLEEVGEVLDEITLNSKANIGDKFSMQHNLLQEVETPKQNFGSEDYDWKQHFIAQLDPLKPTYFDDFSQVRDVYPEQHITRLNVMEHVQFEDERRDHSIESLTPEEHQEIALFHTMKQDPYFKHHLRTHISEMAEENNTNQMVGMRDERVDDPNDFLKYDRINLFDIRRQLPQKARVPKIDSNGNAYGFGKRKLARAQVSVRAGTGRVTVNGKPMNQYFHLPSQRFRILEPLIITSYTCLVDVNIKVKGGGFTGQCEAVRPALSKALQAFDVNTRRPLKYFKLLKGDPRRPERKKPGLQKARKGQVYRRR